MPGHEEWREITTEMGISCPGPGPAGDKVRGLFFDTVSNMATKGWTDSERNRVFARHIAVWMNHCSDSIPPVERQNIANLVQTHIKN